MHGVGFAARRGEVWFSQVWSRKVWQGKDIKVFNRRKLWEQF